MVYECERCHYSTNVRTHFLNHLKKKNVCPNEFSNTSPEDILKKCCEIWETPRQYQCPQCEKSFSHTSGLYRHKKQLHLNTISQSHNNTNSLNTTNTSSSYNTTNISTTNTASNNTTTTTENHTNSHNTLQNPVFNINIFGEERLDYILQDSDLLTKCLKAAITDGLPNLIEKIYLNKDVPENQNVKLKREHHPKQMSVFIQDEDDEDSQWKAKEANEILDKIIVKGHDILVMHKSQLFRLSATPTGTERDTDDLRREKLAAIKSKKKGVYAPVRNRVMLKFAEHKRNENMKETEV